MTIQAATIRPGLLVGLKTSVVGNVSYSKVVLEDDRQTEEGSRFARWETARTITDAKEHEEAGKVRSRVRTLIKGVCAQSEFGLLCPEDSADRLAAAVEEGRLLVSDFNSRARVTRIDVYVIAGRIAPDDVEAVRAISSEMRGLLQDMEQGLRNLNAEAVRAAASKARSVGQMLSPKAQEGVRVAIEAARGAARQMVKAGETAALEIDEVAIRAIAQQRTAFLDLGDATPVATPQAEGRAVDFAPQAVVAAAVAAQPVRQIELD